MAKSDCSKFEVGTTLRGIVIDWSDAEANGLRKAVGDIVANRLLKGCQVHWARSYQRVADKVCRTAEEKTAYNRIASCILCSKSKANVLLHFQVLCREKSVEVLHLSGIQPFQNIHWEKQGHGLNGGPGDVIFKCCAKNSLHLMTWIGSSVQKTQIL